MDLSAAQRRTLEGLIGTGRGPDFPGDLAVRLRDRLEGAIAALELAEPLWIWKRLLTDHARCEGMFEAVSAGEGPPFEHSLQTAAGALFHRAIQLDTSDERGSDVRTVVERAALRLAEQDDFGPFWEGLDRLDRSELLTEATRGLALFRDRFPPFGRRWQPIPEQRLRVKLAADSVVLTGRVDLMLGRRSRLLIDFKTGEARPEHPEDMRFYALLLTLSFGLPPYRVATVFLESGEWQAEDVAEETLEHAAGRVIAAARSAARLRAGTGPALTPGPHCAWCPRGRTCPESSLVARPPAPAS
ncbi:MAG: PD-(D/E)XK nuclease family protein [Actinobacteria bacterium]|nr:PD-(D/E)XK nuclease family protein [Actinomycetota bacterium]